MQTSNHQFLNPPLPADDHRFQFQLYTIPATSGWFSWDNIHQIEKTSLPEFFDNSSVTRNSRVYKEYRDFIISKYREDCSRRLTFSEVRKSLVGDVSYLFSVFLFLEKWGLINFGARGDECDRISEWKVKVEDGLPLGVRVVAVPNSLKPVSLACNVSSYNGSGLGESDFGMAPLASHLDVYQDLIILVCGSCKERCESGHYECTKDGCYIICTKCFKNGSYGNNSSVEDYKFVDQTADNGSVVASWTEEETLLLLESVLKHGDDWDVVAQNVQTKSKQDCISKLLQLPFGHLMLGSAHNRRTSNGKRGPPAPQEIKDTRSQHVEIENKSQQNGDADIEEPPSKRICIAPVSDPSNPKMEQTDKEDEQVTVTRSLQTDKEDEQVTVTPSLQTDRKDEQVTVTPSLQTDRKDEQVTVTPSLQTDREDEQVTEEIREEDGQICELKNPKFFPNVSNILVQQVACISAVVGPHVTTSAAEAAVTALCDENEIPKEIFDGEENGNELSLSTQSFDSERTARGAGLEMDARSIESEKGVIPLPLRMRATSAIALGAAAAHAKLLAVQEEKELERLVSSVINTQLKKLQYKMGLLNEVEVIMEKEYNQMVELEDSLVTERMDVVQKVIDGGVSGWRDKITVKPLEEIIL